MWNGRSKKKTFDPSIDWTFLQSALQGVLSWLPGNRVFSGINSCHSKCLCTCHLLESWFPTNNVVFSFSGSLNQEMSGDSEYIVKSYELFVDARNEGLLKPYIIMELYSNMSFRRHWVTVIEKYKKIFSTLVLSKCEPSLGVRMETLCDPFWGSLEFGNNVGWADLSSSPGAVSH